MKFMMLTSSIFCSWSPWYTKDWKLFLEVCICVRCVCFFFAIVLCFFLERISPFFGLQFDGLSDVNISFFFFRMGLSRCFAFQALLVFWFSWPWLFFSCSDYFLVVINNFNSRFWLIFEWCKIVKLVLLQEFLWLQFYRML